MATQSLSEAYEKLILRIDKGLQAGQVEVFLNVWLGSQPGWIIRSLKCRKIDMNRIPKRRVLRDMGADTKPSLGEVMPNTDEGDRQRTPEEYAVSLEEKHALDQINLAAFAASAQDPEEMPEVFANNDTLKMMYEGYKAGGVNTRSGSEEQKKGLVDKASVLLKMYKKAALAAYEREMREKNSLADLERAETIKSLAREAEKYDTAVDYIASEILKEM